MNKEDWFKLKNIHYWGKYEPEETRYAKYAETNPSLISTGHKIIDVYDTFTRARGMLLYSFGDDYGDLAFRNDINYLYARSQMIIASLLEYAICLDLSWQVIWAYFQPSSLKYLLENNYEEMEKNCTSEVVHSQLNCVTGMHGMGEDISRKVNDLLTGFENDEKTIKLRNMYNYIKHRGTLHIEGLGDNESTMNYTINGKTIPKLSRNSASVVDLQKLLFDYDDLFSNYFSSLISLLIPVEYEETKCSLQDIVQASLNYLKVLNDD